MNITRLNENTYGMTDKPLTHDALLRTVLSYKMFDLLLSTEKLEDLKPGFTVRSNDSGSGSVDDKIIHHIYGSHTNELKGFTAEVTLKIHTLIHNEIFKMSKKIFMNQYGNYLAGAYDNYRQSYSGDMTYETLAIRFKAYEDYFRTVWNIMNQDTYKNTIKDMIRSEINHSRVAGTRKYTEIA